MKLKYLAIIFAVLVLLLTSGCGKEAAPAPQAPVQPAQPEAAQPVQEEQAAEVEEVVEEEEEVEEELPVLEEGADVTAESEELKEEIGLAGDLTIESEGFPQASCELKDDDGKEVRVISVVIKNVADEDLEVYAKGHSKGKIRIGSRGVIDIEPGCEDFILAAGQSTKCTEINQGVIAGENRVTVNVPGNQYARAVMCP